jgi:hypothetical protein
LVVTAAGSQPAQTRLDVAERRYRASIRPQADRPDPSSGGIGVNKILAPFDRGEARDLGDLAQIDAHYKLQDLLVSAKAKDRAFEPGVYEMLRLSVPPERTAAFVSSA